jgi:hypothetical protein
MEKPKWLQVILAMFKEFTIIVLASVAVIGLFKASGYFTSEAVNTSSTMTNGAPLAVDAQLSIKSVDFARHPLSLILVTSPTCPYCLASKDFHRTVESESNSNDVPFYVAVPSKKNASGYLHELGFDSNRVKEWGDLNLAVSGTPTLIAVNENAIVSACGLARSHRIANPIYSDSLGPGTYLIRIPFRVTCCVFRTIPLRI